MRFVFISLILFSVSGFATSDSKVTTSFEENYARLEKKIADMKAKGQKINEDTRKEIESLMAQMNREHKQLEAELEKRNQQMKAAMTEAKDTKEDWVNRFKGAYGEISSGASRAWHKLKNGDN